MNTDFVIVLDPEIDEGELILVVSKLNKGDDKMEVLGAFTGNDAKELLDLFLEMKDKEENNNDGT